MIPLRSNSQFRLDSSLGTYMAPFSLTYPMSATSVAAGPDASAITELALGPAERGGPRGLAGGAADRAADQRALQPGVICCQDEPSGPAPPTRRRPSSPLSGGPPGSAGGRSVRLAPPFDLDLDLARGEGVNVGDEEGEGGFAAPPLKPSLRDVAGDERARLSCVDLGSTDCIQASH